MSDVFLRPGAGEHPETAGPSGATSGGDGAVRAPGPGRPAVVRTVLLVLGLFVVLGVVAGVVWWLVAPTAEFTKLRDGSGTMGDVDLGRQFDADGCFVVVGAVVGLVSGLVLMGLTLWRRAHELVVLPAMLAGSLLAALVADQVGRLLGPGSPGEALKGAAVGTRVPDVLAVHALSAYLAWPVAVLFGALLVLLGPEHAPKPAAPPGGPTPPPATPTPAPTAPTPPSA